MKKRLVASLMSVVLAMGLMPVPALAGEASGLVAANAEHVLWVQAKKPSNAVKKKMKAAYRKILKQARAKSATYNGMGFGNSYTIFDMGADGYPELFVETSDPSWGGSYHVFDFTRGKLRNLGICYLSDGWLYGTSKGALYCTGGRQGVYYVDQVKKSSGQLVKTGKYGTDVPSRMNSWLSKRGAKPLKTKPVSSFSLLNSKIKVKAAKIRKMSQAKVSVAKSAKYTGKAVKPKVTVRLAGKTLKAGKGYTVSYRNAKGKKVSAPKAVGTYKVTVTGKGNLKGSVTRTFKVVKAASNKAALDKKAKRAYAKVIKSLSSANHRVYYKYADVTGGSTVELVALVFPTEAMPSRDVIYTMKSGKPKRIMNRNSYGYWNRLAAHKGAKSLVFYSSSHNVDSYSYYKLVSGKFKQVAARSRMWGSSSWSYGVPSGSTYKTVSKAAFNKKVKPLLKGKTKKVAFKGAKLLTNEARR